MTDKGNLCLGCGGELLELRGLVKDLRVCPVCDGVHRPDAPSDEDYRELWEKMFSTVKDDPRLIYQLFRRFVTDCNPPNFIQGTEKEQE